MENRPRLSSLAPFLPPLPLRPFSVSQVSRYNGLTCYHPFTTQVPATLLAPYLATKTSVERAKLCRI